MTQITESKPTSQASPTVELRHELSVSISPTETARLLLRQMRPKQWVKNFIVFAPLLFFGKFSDVNLLVLATGATVAFCLISSAVYILNDVVDVEADRVHPTKCRRPIASGMLDINLARFAGLVCLASGLIVAFLVRPTLVIACIGYLILNVLYSLKLKNTPIVDIFCIAAGFVIRAVAGALAVKVAASAWLLLCTSLGALFLATEKRRQELKLLDASSGSHRKVLAEYSPTIVSRMESVIVPSLLTSYAIYSFNSPHGQWMMITVPIVLYGLMRYQMLSEKGTITGAPEDVFWKDRPIQITLFIWLLACAFVIYGSPANLLHFVGATIDSFHF